MEYTTEVPLFASGAQACSHGLADIDFPGEAARDLITKIASNRPDVRYR